MKHLGLLAAAATLALGISAASADECSGHAHDSDTAVGAVGGGLVGGLATHSVAGGLVGAVVGGVAGNAIGRANDCDHVAAEDRHDAYAAGRDDQAAADADMARDDQASRDADRAYPPD